MRGKDIIRRWICGLCFLCLAVSVRAQSKEYEVKAAFLLNFAEFIQWPPGAFPEADAPLVIGVLGNDPFGSALEETVRDEKVQSHKLVIRRAHHVEDLDGCQMVFVCKSERHVPELLARLDSRPVVTVGDSEGFARHGGTIDFYLEQNKVRFEINPESARQNGVKISSRLLALGRVVGPSANEK
jgi:YfiR/HmsC-like